MRKWLERLPPTDVAWQLSGTGRVEVKDQIKSSRCNCFRKKLYFFKSIRFENRNVIYLIIFLRLKLHLFGSGEKLYNL